MPIAARRPPRYTPAGIELPRGVDTRTKASRRFIALVTAYEAELGGSLTEADKALVKQAAALTLQTEQLQADIISGAKVDPDTLIRVSSEARRILTKLKTKKSKPAAPTSLHDLLEREENRA
jgi:hypothetical protein